MLSGTNHKYISEYIFDFPCTLLALGHPWLKAHNPTIDWEQNKITGWNRHSHDFCLSQERLLGVGLALEEWRNLLKGAERPFTMWVDLMLKGDHPMAHTPRCKYTISFLHRLFWWPFLIKIIPNPPSGELELGPLLVPGCPWSCAALDCATGLAPSAENNHPKYNPSLFQDC